MKKIFIMGAGIYQVPLIETAKRFGLYTMVASIPGKYPGFAVADKVFYVNTTDKESILRIAEEEQIDGICTAGTDVAVATIGYVNRHMGLNGISEEAANTASDKALMQDAFKSNGVSSARHFKAESLQEAFDVAEEIGYPVVVKCVDSSGSRGISIVEKEGELESAFNEAKRFTRRPYVVVEEKLGGMEIGIDGIVRDGKILFLAPHTKCTYLTSDNVITAGHDFPFVGNDAVLDNIRKQTVAAVEAIGLDNCAINIDAFVDGDEVSLIEIGGRSGATCIPELITMCYGFDYYEAILRLSLGQDMNEMRCTPSNSCRGRLIMSPEDGLITDVDEKGLKGIQNSGVRVSLDYSVGDRIEKMKNGTDRIGQVIAVSSDNDQMREIMDMVYGCISVDGHTLEELWNE